VDTSVVEEQPASVVNVIISMFPRNGGCYQSDSRLHILGSHRLVFTVMRTLNCSLFSVKCCSALFDRVSSSDQYNPATCGLPLFLLHLTTGVIWDEEKSCFDSFCREISRFYSRQLESDYWEDGHEDNVSQVHICHAPVVLIHTVIGKKTE